MGGDEYRISLHCHLELEPLEPLEPLSQPLHSYLYIIWLWWPVRLKLLGLSQRTGTNRGRVLQQLIQPEHSKRQQMQELHLSVK